MKGNESLWKWGWRVWPITGLVVFNLVRELARSGWFLGWQAFRLSVLFDSGLMIGGWIVGFLLVDFDKYAKKYMKANSESLELMVKQWQSAVRNILTVAAVLGLGVWVVSSAGNTLAIGIVLGLEVRLFSEFLADKDQGSWYWVFARAFSKGENRIVTLVWAATLLAQVVMMARG